MLRTQFENNLSTKDGAEGINKLLSEINETYFDNSNLNDLTDETYMNKIEEKFGTKQIPHFLLREGFRLRRFIQKNIGLIKNNNEADDYEKEKIDIKFNKDSDLYNMNDKNNIKIEKESEIYNIKEIVKEIRNYKYLPFEKKLNEMYLIILLLSLKDIDNNRDIFKAIEHNLNSFCDYFQINKINSFREFKKKYIDINIEDLQQEIISMELSQVNNSEYLSKYTLAFYYVIISLFFKKSNPNSIYINILLFLQKFIHEEHNKFLDIIQNELNSVLLHKYDDNNNKDENTLNTDQFIIPEYINTQSFIDVYGDNEGGDNYHQAKILNFNSIEYLIYSSDNNSIKKRFDLLVKEEELYEKGSNDMKYKIINFLKEEFKIKEDMDDETIQNKLILYPYKTGLFPRGPILILVSGYYSSNSDHYSEWKGLIDVYKKKFNNPIIYYLNWPSSKITLDKLIFHKTDFINTKLRGSFCGKILALMIMSNNIFNGFKINLVGFSLGTQVIKHCIKELELFGKLNLINNIIFLGGVAHIENNFKWEKRLNTFKGVIINCYSIIDVALFYSKSITNKVAIGSQKLKIYNVNIKNYSVKLLHVLYRISMYIIGNLFMNDLIE